MADFIMTKELANQTKHRLRKAGHTLKSFCAANDISYRTATELLQGKRKANYGIGREVAIQLGLIDDTTAQDKAS